MSAANDPHWTIESLENGTLDVESFNHEAHIYVGWLYLGRYPLASAYASPTFANNSVSACTVLSAIEPISPVRRVLQRFATMPAEGVNSCSPDLRNAAIACWPSVPRIQTISACAPL